MTSDTNITGALPVPPDIGPPEPSSTGNSGGKAADVKDSAKEQAAQVGSAATGAAGETVSTAKDQIGTVASEAAGHAKDLWSQATSDIGEQATQQTQRLTANIRQLADHLTTMADNGDGGEFVEVTLHPRVTITAASDEAKARTLHAGAHQRCYIASSVKFPVRNEPQIVKQ